MKGKYLSGGEVVCGQTATARSADGRGVIVLYSIESDIDETRSVRWDAKCSDLVRHTHTLCRGADLRWTTFQPHMSQL